MLRLKIKLKKLKKNFNIAVVAKGNNVSLEWVAGLGFNPRRHTKGVINVVSDASLLSVYVTKARCSPPRTPRYPNKRWIPFGSSG